MTTALIIIVAILITAFVLYLEKIYDQFRSK